MITYVQWKFAGELIVCTTICICISFERLLAYFKKFTKKNKTSSSPALSDRTDENCKYDN